MLVVLLYVITYHFLLFCFFIPFFIVSYIFHQCLFIYLHTVRCINRCGLCQSGSGDMDISAEGRPLGARSPAARRGERCVSAAALRGRPAVFIQAGRGIFLLVSSSNSDRNKASDDSFKGSRAGGVEADTVSLFSLFS